MIPTLLTLILFQAGGLQQTLETAQALADQNRFEEALALLDKQAGAEKNDPRVLGARGAYLLHATEAKAASGALKALDAVDAFNQAAGLLEKAAGSTDASPAVFVNWSEALLNANDVQNALRALKKGLSVHADALPLELQLGRALTARFHEVEGLEGKSDAALAAAERAYRKAMDDHPESGTAAVRFGEIKVLAKDLPAAQEAWREALKRSPDEVDLNAMVAWLPGKPGSELLEERIKSAGETALLRWYQALAEYNAVPRLWRQARKHFQRALELNPDFGNVWWYLGEGAIAEGQRIQKEKGGTAMAPAAAKAYLEAAAAWAHYVKLFGPNLLQSIRTAADHGEAQVRKFIWLGGIAYQGRDFESAYELARLVAQARPEDVAAWNNFALFCRDGGRAEEALKAYEAALRLSPDDPQIMNDLAVILQYNLKKDSARAADLYRKAIARAEEILAAPEGLSTGEKVRIQTALRDARNNLTRLTGGDAAGD